MNFAKRLTAPRKYHDIEVQYKIIAEKKIKCERKMPKQENSMKIENIASL